MFLDVVPVGLLHRAAARRDAGPRSSRPVRPLFVSRRVLIFKNPLHLQARLQGGAFIEEKKCLAAVSDKDDCAMRQTHALCQELAAISGRPLHYDLLFLAPRHKGNGASDGQPKRDFGTGNHSNRRCDRHIGHVERAGAAVEVLKVK